MATITAKKNGSFQLRVTSKLLPKPFYATFPRYEDARRYGTQLEKLLTAGHVPELLSSPTPVKRTAWRIQRCIAEYVRRGTVKHSEIKIFDSVNNHIGTTLTSKLDVDWAEK